MKTIIKLSLLLIAISFASCEKSVYDYYYLDNSTGEDIIIYSPVFFDGLLITAESPSVNLDLFPKQAGSSKVTQHRAPSELLCGNRGAIYVTFFYKGKYYRESSFADNSILVQSAWILESDTKSVDHYSFDITEEYILSLPESDR